jgi:hypothetical protein
MNRRGYVVDLGLLEIGQCVIVPDLPYKMQRTLKEKRKETFHVVVGQKRRTVFNGICG